MHNFIYLSKDGEDPYINMFALGSGGRVIRTEDFNYSDSQDPIVLRGILKKKLIMKIDGSFRNEYGYPIDKWKLNINYKLEAQNRTIDKFGLPKTQEPLPTRKVRYFVTLPDGTKKEV